MIDVGNKKVTERKAQAQAFVRLSEDVLQRIKAREVPKGDVIEQARIAGIMAAKKTPELIPLCHTINVEHVEIEFAVEGSGIRIISTVKASAKTGVEMEALVAASTAALTVYDMCKMFGQRMEISDIFLIEKTGGKSDYHR